MIAPDNRRWTALFLGGLWAATLIGAIPVLRLGVAEVEAARGATSAVFVGLIDNPLVGEKAREARFDLAPPIDPARQVEELSDILVRRPLSSFHWLELARARYAAGAPPKTFFDAVAMSQLTGPNEAAIMASRAVFGLSLWPLASADMRKSLIRDLVGGWPQVAETRRMLLRIMLDDARPQTRTELLAALAPFNAAGADVATRLGLDAAR